VATVGTAPANRELIADESAATAGEDRRATGEACAVLLVTHGGRTSEPAAIRSQTGQDPATAGPDAAMRHDILMPRYGWRDCSPLHFLEVAAKTLVRVSSPIIIGSRSICEVQ
jgi:hypothetical protein